MALADARLLRYDTTRYPFAQLACAALGVDDLGRLHESALAEAARPRPRYRDNVALRERLAERLRASGFQDTYGALVHDVVSPLFGRHVSYSRMPQVRVHLAGSPSASAWHVDHEVLRRSDQINAWLPFVDTWGANTIWVESDYGAGDHHPIPVRYGEMLLFDGAWLGHGTVPNDSGHTRVSIDFRFAPREPGVLERFLPSQARREQRV